MRIFWKTSPLRWPEFRPGPAAKSLRSSRDWTCQRKDTSVIEHPAFAGTLLWLPKPPPYNLSMPLDLLSPALSGLLAEEPAPVADVTVLRASRRAMATLFEVLLPFGYPQAQLAAEAGLDRIDELEDQLTVFRDHSEVSRLNATAADGPVEVEPGLFELIESAAHLTRQTNGAFDIATGALIKAWGFYKRQGRVPTPAERTAALARTGTRFIALDRDRRTVRYLRKGLEINLGGIGKGYALDRAAELLHREWARRVGPAARRDVERAASSARRRASRAAGRSRSSTRGTRTGGSAHCTWPTRRWARRRPRFSTLSTMAKSSATCWTRGPGGPRTGSSRCPSSPLGRGGRRPLDRLLRPRGRADRPVLPDPPGHRRGPAARRGRSARDV